jgi:nicotinate-nucleotide pyrophosphorylase (carboxylating)
MNSATILRKKYHFDLHAFIKKSLQEDIGSGDHTTLACVPAHAKGKAQLLVKESGIIAGVELAQQIFKAVDKKLRINIFIKDASQVKSGDVVMEVSGKSQSILMAERLVLNCMQRMSGIATTTNKLVIMCKNTGTQLLDTRKTTPTIRALEKWAVTIGGGVNHRVGLYDMMMIKDNHIDYCGGIKQAIEAALGYQKQHKLKLKIEVEARNLDEVNEILNVGNIHRIMLDNFSITELKKAITLINGRYETEASGGITEKNIVSYAKCGVDFISVGALTHQIKSLDLSLKAI